MQRIWYTEQCSFPPPPPPSPYMLIPVLAPVAFVGTKVSRKMCTGISVCTWEGGGGSRESD